MLQLVDAAGNALVPKRRVDAHLDHLRVPAPLRPALPAIKVLSSVGLVLGLNSPRLGTLTSAALVGYYAAAVGYHLRAGDHPALAVPAAVFGAAAAAALFGVFVPAAGGA
ncbi:MAG: DoxX family protein [Acidimicrobiales bacterium]